MTFIILGVAAAVAIVLAAWLFVVEFFPREQEDLFSNLPWAEIIEGKV